ASPGLCLLSKRSSHRGAKRGALAARNRGRDGVNLVTGPGSTGAWSARLLQATAGHTLRARPSQYYGVMRLAVAMQLTRLMATRMGYLDVSFRRSVSPARCRMSTT